PAAAVRLRRHRLRLHGCPVRARAGRDGPRGPCRVPRPRACPAESRCLGVPGAARARGPRRGARVPGRHDGPPRARHRLQHVHHRAHHGAVLVFRRHRGDAAAAGAGRGGAARGRHGGPDGARAVADGTVSASPVARGAAGDRSRLFVTALLVYAACLNPMMFNPMTWASLDTAVSLVHTGRWQVTHGSLYGDMDVARDTTGRPVLGPPPGLALVLVPVYGLWRLVAGAVETPEAFQALHVFATLSVAAVASALAAGEVAVLAAWLGASRRGRLWAAILFAFGTPAFLFATRLFKENVAALALIAAFR